jgi:hypothetical protein
MFFIIGRDVCAEKASALGPAEAMTTSDRTTIVQTQDDDDATIAPGV